LKTKQKKTDNHLRVKVVVDFIWDGHINESIPNGVEAAGELVGEHVEVQTGNLDGKWGFIESVISVEENGAQAVRERSANLQGNENNPHPHW